METDWRESKIFSLRLQLRFHNILKNENAHGGMISIHSCAECNAMSSDVHSGRLRAVDRLHLTEGYQIEMTLWTSAHKIFIGLLS